LNADGQQVDGPLVYRLMDGQSAAAFYVDTTGADAAVLRTSVELDREVRAKYRVLVRATDSAQRSADAEVVVMVTDVNDNAPSFPQFPPINIREGMICTYQLRLG